MTLDAACRWHWAGAPPAQVRRLSAEIGVGALTAEVLVRRGLGGADAARRFLAPRLSDVSDPFLLPGVREAAGRLWKAIANREPIVVFGDYDVDGVTGSALLLEVLQALGARADWFIPHREAEGYGFTVPALRRCLTAFTPGLIVTVDCGIASHDAVRFAGGQGIDVIVTDHHEPGTRALGAVAAVNPRWVADPEVSLLAGVGTVFKLCHGLIKAGRSAGQGVVRGVDLREWLPLVALGTVADVAPLLGENRVFVFHGLQRLNRRPSAGLQALQRAAGLEGQGVEARHLAFALGPRLNAAGRMQDARPAMELLLERHPHRARELAERLDRVNAERRRVEERMRGEAEAQLAAAPGLREAPGVVVAAEGWHVGTIGIVASRLASRLNRPAAVIAFRGGEGKASCRSIAEVDLVDVLGKCGHLLEAYGGHAMAAGFTIRRSALEAFRGAFASECALQMGDGDVRPALQIDAWLRLADWTTSAYGELEALAPFGQGNSRPLIGCCGVGLCGRPRVVGGEHLKMTLSQGNARMAAIGFGLGKRGLPGPRLDAVGHLRLNRFRGACTAEMEIRDFREHREAPYGNRVRDANRIS